MVGKLLSAVRYTWRFHDYTAEQHARHGGNWTLKLPGLPDSVVTSDPALVKQLLTGDPLSRRHANDILLPALGEHSVLLLEPVPHLARRKQLLPPFHGERVQGYGALVRRLVEADLDTWADGEVVQVLEHSRALTLGVIQEAVFGTRDDAFARRLTEILDMFASPVANFGLFAPALSQRAWWNLPAEVFHRKRDALDALMAERITARRGGEPGDDILWMLLDLPDAELIDELKTLLVAGHETTATSIAWAADLFAHHPDVAERVRTGDQAYRAAAAKEVMRLRTVLPISVTRTLLEPAGDLPAGTTVLVHAGRLHHDPALHPEPEAFRPERFLDGGPPPYSYLPFGGGAHRCIGAALASLELEIAIEAMLERFHLEPVGPPAKPVRRGPTFVPAGGAPVRVRARA